MLVIQSWKTPANRSRGRQKGPYVMSYLAINMTLKAVNYTNNIIKTSLVLLTREECVGGRVLEAKATVNMLFLNPKKRHNDVDGELVRSLVWGVVFLVLIGGPQRIGRAEETNNVLLYGVCAVIGR